MTEKIATNNAPNAIGPYSQAVKCNNKLHSTRKQTALKQQLSKNRQDRFAKTLKPLLKRQVLLWTKLLKLPVFLQI